MGMFNSFHRVRTTSLTESTDVDGVLTRDDPMAWLAGQIVQPFPAFNAGQLMNNLISSLVNRYGHWDNVPQELKDQLSGYFEEGIGWIDGPSGQAQQIDALMRAMYEKIHSGDLATGGTPDYAGGIGGDYFNDPYNLLPVEAPRPGYHGPGMSLPSDGWHDAGESGAGDGGEIDHLEYASFLAPQTDTRWHHLLVQKYREKFTKALKGSGDSINDAKYGWIMNHDDHVAITQLWEDQWDEFFRTHQNPTKAQIVAKLNKMKTLPIFKEYLSRGVQADKSYSQWSRLKAPKKDAEFAKLRKGAGLIGGLLVGIGAAADADAAFSPVLALGDEAAQRDYQNALVALRDNRHDVAEKALFGEYHTGAGAAVIFEKNPRGLIPKMLSRMVEANELSYAATIGVLNKAWRQWNSIKNKATNWRSSSVYGPF